MKTVMIILMGMLLISSVSALSQETFDKLDFWDQIRYRVFYDGGLFSAWGSANQCMDDPGEEFWLEPHDSEIVRCTDYCDFDKCAIDVWWQSPQSYPAINWDWYYKEVAGEGVSHSNSGNSLYQYVQVYCCPDLDPDPDHETDTYKCENGNWVYKGDFAYDDSCSPNPRGGCFCNDEDDKFYIDESGNEHCANSPSSSWCTAYAGEGETCGLNSNGPFCESGLSCANFQCVAPATCGDNICQYPETMSSCPNDCGEAPVCGDGVCDIGENPGATYDCPSDCDDEPVCNTDADEDCNGQVDRNELGSYITKWIANQVSRTKLGQAISAWSN